MKNIFGLSIIASIINLDILTEAEQVLKSVPHGTWIMQYHYSCLLYTSQVYVIRKNKKNPLKDELYTETAHYKKIVAEN